MKNYRKILALGAVVTMVFGLVFFVTPTLAQDKYGLKKTADKAGLDKYGSDVSDIAGNVIGSGLSLIAVFFFVLVVYGGFTWMTAHGNEEQIKKSLNTIVAAIVGMIIVIASYAITSFVFNSVTPQSAVVPGTPVVPSPVVPSPVVPSPVVPSPT